VSNYQVVYDARRDTIRAQAFWTNVIAIGAKAGALKDTPRK